MEPAKRRKPAPRRSARLQSGGGAAAAAAASPSAARASSIGAADDGPSQRGAKRKREEDEIDLRHAEERAALERDGYLRLVQAEPSPEPANLPADAPPTILLAAQRRLAIAELGSARLGAGSILLSDVAEMVAFHIRGFDHGAEAAKVEEHGEQAAAARLQFRPPLPAAGEKPEATGFLLEGHPQAAYEGVYRLHSEHKGWPVLKNAMGAYLDRITREDVIRMETWRLDLEGAGGPKVPGDGFIEATEGPLPVGANAWFCMGEHNGLAEPELEERTLTVTLLPTAADVRAAEQRVMGEREQLSAARAAVARAQLESVREVVVAGCPSSECNGSYVPGHAHEGWPRFENEHGRHLYHFAGHQQWFINDRFAPGVDETLVFLDSADGALPLGQRDWALTEPGNKAKMQGRHSVTVSLQQ